MTKSARKDFFREIRGSMGRFLSILFISLLGVAIFAGVGSTAPDMKRTADATFDKANLMDIQVLGTLGVTESDMAAIMHIDGVVAAEGSYQKDMICVQNGREYIVKAISVPKQINKVTLVDGTMPKAEDECVVDLEFVKATGYDIGATIQLQNGTEYELFSSLKNTKFTIVGTVMSAMYLNSERGTSSIGDGSVSAYVMLPEEAFSMDSYSAIYLTVDGAKELDSYSKDYQQRIDTVINGIKEIADSRSQIRYEEVSASSEELLKRADEEYANGKATAQEKLDDAYNKLKNANQTIVDGRNAIADKEEELVKAQETIIKAETAVAQAKGYLSNAKTQLEDGQKSYDEYVKTLKAMRESIEKQKKELEGLDLNTDEAKGKQLSIALAEASADELEKQLKEAKQKLADGKKQVERYDEMLKKYEEQLETAKLGVTEANSQIEIAKTQLEEAETELEYGKQDYSLARKETEEELVDAEKRLLNAREYINNLPSPQWYVLDRDSVISCAGIKEDIKSIQSIATIFPIFFFIIAALVALTTMTRMVEEERTQIGTLKALGYGNGAIASKYIMYAFLASFIGGVAGFLLGERFVPLVVLNAYKASYYGLSAPQTPYNIMFAAISLLVSVVCICLATYFACRKSLKASSAELMRPEPPKNGKRILLERVYFIWSRLSFTQKAAMRNLFRYKKRFFMTVFGIGGCMALLLVAFGIGDSVDAMSEKQYNEIFNYNFTLGYENDIDRTGRRELVNAMNVIDGVEGEVQVYRAVQYFEADGKGMTGYFVVPENLNNFKSFIHLQNRATGERLELGNDGVIISEKLAELLGVRAGDNITIKDSENASDSKTVPIAGITENYVLHYVYMSPEMYESVFNVSVPYNAMHVKAQSDDEVLFVSQLMTLKGVSSASTIASEKAAIVSMTTSLNSVVIILIIAAALLAFIVLYNLNNININERRRELATIKLLGFYNKELAAYVYRENVILTVIGIAVGTVVGIFLHRFIMQTAESDMIMLGRQLHWLSYVLSIALSAFFALTVNLLMYKKFKRVNMVESLKSVE